MTFVLAKLRKGCPYTIDELIEMIQKDLYKTANGREVPQGCKISTKNGNIKDLRIENLSVVLDIQSLS
jgi:hypothetical protein